jgi:hypothetical protein
MEWYKIGLLFIAIISILAFAFSIGDNNTTTTTSISGNGSTTINNYNNITNNYYNNTYYNISSGGNPFNQVLNTTSDVNFSTLKVDTFNSNMYTGASLSYFGGDYACLNDDCNFYSNSGITYLGISGSTTTVNGDFGIMEYLNTNIIPKTNNTYALGSSTLKYSEVWGVNGYFNNVPTLSQTDERYYNNTQYRINRTTATFITNSGSYVPLIKLTIGDNGYRNNEIYCEGVGYSSIATTGLHFQGDITSSAQDFWHGQYTTSATSANVDCVSDATSSIACEPASGSLTGKTFWLRSSNIMNSAGVFTLSIKSEIATTSNVTVYRYAFCELKQW